MTSDAPASARTRFAGLDGLRAIAVLLVVVYHLFPGFVLRGGFIGVDVFFVISGFLITTLLLREHAHTGRIRLVDFWRRRVRRLLPALALVVTVCATAAWVIGGDVLMRLGEQVLGAFTFSYNWLSIADAADYFGGGTPELFRNFWSLAVEEQFYVVWPLVLPVLLLLPRAWGRVGAVLALAAASAVWMGVVAASGGLTRAYFGTDTHAFGILLGVALAFALVPVLSRPAAALAPAVPVARLAAGWTVVVPQGALQTTDAASRTRVRRATAIVGALAVAGLVAVATAPAATGAAFPVAIVLASVLSAVAIVAAVWPGSAFGPAIDRPLRWVGDRSYGIYLWHWPLLVLAVAATQRTGPEAGFSPWLGLGVLLLTVVAAELSYRFVETPIRRLGFRGAGRALAASLRGTPAARLGALSVVVATGLVVGGTSAAIASSPDETSGEAAVKAGLEALERAKAEESTAPTDAPPSSDSATPTPGEATDAPPTPGPTASASATPPPTSLGPSGQFRGDGAPVLAPVTVTGDQVTAIGDSVMLASAPALLERLPGISIDAAVSRSTWAGPGIVEGLAAGGALRPYLVIALGTNGPVSLEALDAMVAAAGRDRIVVLVNAYGPRDWIPGVNADLSAFAKDRRNVVVADWASAIAPRADLLAGDQIHPGDAGGRVFADVVAAALDQAATDRAQRRYDVRLRFFENLRDNALPRAE